MTPSPTPDPALLRALAQTRMPFGKYQGRYLAHLPDAYLVWFARQGFPRGKLGEMLRMMHELKVAGLDHLLRPLIREGNAR